MRYIGGKSLLTEDILEVIKKKAKKVDSVIDIFAGSGAVSTALKKKGYSVYSNDILYFSYVINRGSIDINQKPLFNGLDIEDREGCYYKSILLLI